MSGRHRMNTWVISLVALAFLDPAYPSESWRSDRPCGTLISKFEAVEGESCLQKLCSNTNAFKTNICACLKDEDTGETQISIASTETLAAPETKFNVEIFPSLLAPKGLRVQAGDYVGNGKNQLLLAIKTDESNGMAVQSWKLVVIDDLKVSKPLNVVDFGVMSYSTEPKAGGKCRILASEWREGWEPRRGNGLYIVGRWLEFFDGRFSVTSSRPILFHRYLFSLEQKRLSAMSEIHHMPVLWFKSDGARIVIGPDPLP